jgi:NAD(P)-dependent dehydrogenase (short-subunit alcohol dehydrogenase family)
MQTLYGRVAVVVAASDGVGAAIARCFGELGALVVVNYASDKAGAERVVAKIVRSGGRAVAVQSDMANEAGFGNAVSCARLNFGNPDFVFNNTRDYLQDVSAPVIRMAVALAARRSSPSASSRSVACRPTTSTSTGSI